MIIGVDAGALSVKDDRLKVGVYRVNLELLKEFSKIDKVNNYRLYSFFPIEKSVMKQFGSNMTNVVLTPSFGYMSIRLPLELRQRPVDVFLGLSQALPTNIKAKKIGFIYDTSFLEYPEAYGITLHNLIKHTKQLVHLSDQIITISKTSKQQIVEAYHYPESQITVSYPGMSSRFTLRGKKLVSKRPYILFVGALKRGKNVPTAIWGFAEFLKKTRLVYDFYIIGGDYWPDANIEKAIEESGATSHIRLLGYADEERLPEYYRGATAFLTPSITEGFCLPAVEAMACGTPVIVSDLAVFREIVGDAGFFVNPKDVSSIANALELLTTQKKVRISFRNKGLEKVELYSWKVFAKTVFDTLKY